MNLSLPRSFPGIGRVIALHVIERLPSRGVEPAQKNQVLTKDVDTGSKQRTRIAQMERFILRHLSSLPVSASLWTDLSPANVVVTTVAVITLHVIELVRRSGLLEMVVRNAS